MFLFCARMIECGRSIRIAQAVRGLHAKGSYRANPELRGSVVLARSGGYCLYEQVCNRPLPFLQSKIA